MEHEERSKGLAEYVERRRGDVFEVMAYSGTIEVDEREFTRPSKIPRYQRILIIPLPPDFDWTKMSNPDTSKHYFPNAIMITEDEIRYRRKGKKRVRPLTVFLDKPGRISVKEVVWTGEIGDRAKVWISEERFKSITKRNLYVDKFYADQIFNRGKNNSDL